MTDQSFLSYGSFCKRIEHVNAAVNVLSTNHIMEGNTRAVFAFLYNTGLNIKGNIPKRYINTSVIPFIRNVIDSLVTVGYFAFVFEKLTPVLLEMDSYILVPPLMCTEAIKCHPLYDLLFIRQQEHDKYRNITPILYIHQPPKQNGNITTACLKIVDMNDWIVEYNRLALLNDAMNMRPKCWITKKNEKDTVLACYPYYESAGNTAGDTDGITSADEREKKLDTSRNYVNNENYLKAMKQQEIKQTTTFLKTCMPRIFPIDAENNPSVVVEVLPGTDVVPMPSTHTRQDLVDLMRLFDQRMCNALGVPPTIIGLPAPTNVSLDPEQAIKLWVRSLIPYRDIINLALEDIVNTFVQVSVLKAREAQNNGPSESFEYGLELQKGYEDNELYLLQPFLTPAAFARHMSRYKDIPLVDFRKEDPYELTAKRKKIN